MRGWASSANAGGDVSGETGNTKPNKGFDPGLQLMNASERSMNLCLSRHKRGSFLTTCSIYDILCFVVIINNPKKLMAVTTHVSCSLHIFWEAGSMSPLSETRTSEATHPSPAVLGRRRER